MLSSAGEGNLCVVGGGNVASQFADEGVLDEVLVTVIPVVFGTERRSSTGGRRAVDATRSRVPRSSGMVELRYRVRR